LNQKVFIGQETSLLLKDLEGNGDYVNSQYFPSLIKASVVFEELEKNNLIIDLRSPESFRKGHIRGAVSKTFSDLPEYFETGIRPFEYNRIIMVCDDGQLSSYTTAFLRLFGYDARTLRYGNNSFMHDKMVKDKAALSWLPFTLAESNDYPVVK